MSEKFTQIIHPDTFIADKSSTIIARLCRDDYEPTDAEIASLVVQYLWRYHRK
ncbi:hypothetical protein H6768_06020 [Candidatus Peribacteria bacterium]|nr:hypothetical protein [Candidatus Peribacteria bacterium]